MSLSVYTYLRIAVPLTPDELLRTASTEITCERGHKKTGPAPFCDQDGTKFTEKALKEPIPGFKSYCDENGYDDYNPLVPFEDDSGPTWGNVESLDGSEHRHPKTHLIRNVIEISDHRCSGPSQVNWETLQAETRALEALVEKLTGERRPSGVYVCMYHSF